MDLVPLHVEAARDRGIDAVVADARDLPEADGAYDAVLLGSPSKHNRHSGNV